MPLLRDSHHLQSATAMIADLRPCWPFRSGFATRFTSTTREPSGNAPASSLAPDIPYWNRFIGLGRFTNLVEMHDYGVA